MANKFLASARVSLVALALGGVHLACGVGKDNEERFFSEMRDDIERTQSEGFNAGDEMDQGLVGSADPRARGSRGVASPPPPNMTMRADTSDRASEQAEGWRERAADTGGAAGASRPAEDDGEVLSFTNANLAAALAQYSAKRTSGAGDGKSGTVKKARDAGAP
jgi:hypothetical protein